MGKIAPGRRQVGIVIDERLASVIDKRAKGLGLAPSRFTALIVQKWEAEGCPAVSEPDRLMQVAAKAEGAPKAGKRVG